MFFRALLILMVVISAAQATPIFDYDDTNVAFFEKVTEESTRVLRETLNLDLGTSRDDVIKHINAIARNELRNEKVAITPSSLANRTFLKRAALLCGLDVSSTRDETVTCLKQLYGSNASEKATQVSRRIFVELMHILAHALNRPVGDFYSWSNDELNNMLSALPDTPLE